MPDLSKATLINSPILSRRTLKSRPIIFRGLTARPGPLPIMPFRCRRPGVRPNNKLFTADFLTACAFKFPGSAGLDPGRTCNISGISCYFGEISTSISGICRLKCKSGRILTPGSVIWSNFAPAQAAGHQPESILNKAENIFDEGEKFLIFFLCSFLTN